MRTDLPQLVAGLKAHALDIGFDLVGIAPANASTRADYLRDWLASGQAGEMEYLNRRFDERVNPAVYLPGARSVICLAANYHTGAAAPPPTDRSIARIARYALGDDYHDWLKHRLFQLADWIRDRAPDAITRCAVDTAPVMEKELAAHAGIGWIGKNTCVINPRIGSWILLGEILTTLELPPDAPAVDRCGTCRRCLDACPTGAITAPYQLDARRCISYLTIEHRSKLSESQGLLIDDWLFGCDICQEVCPWNDRALPSLDPHVRPRFPHAGIPVRDILDSTDEQLRPRLRGSPIRRVKLPVLHRNAAIIAVNQATSETPPSSTPGHPGVDPDDS